jgi:hypothetical protein
MYTFPSCLFNIHFNIDTLGTEDKCMQVFGGKIEGSSSLLEPLGLDGKMVLKWVGRCGLAFTGTGQGPVAGPFAHGTKSSGSVKFGDFVDYLRNYSLLKKTLVQQMRLRIYHFIVVSSVMCALIS